MKRLSDGVSYRPMRADRRPGGLTFLELMIALSILAIVAAALGGLARTSEQAFQYSQGYGTATQHARIVLDRIQRHVSEATANEQFPGCLVIATMVNSQPFPDTLVIWHPTSAVADPEGLPRFSELIIYTPGEENPHQLWEMTIPADTQTVPPPNDIAAWQFELAAMKQSEQAQKTVLTDLLHTCAINTGAGGDQWQAAVRFLRRLRPSEADWNDYLSGAVVWQDLPWIQGLYGANTGVRQVWIRSELQLLPQITPDNAASRNQMPVPFFGSVALYYELHHQ